MGIVKRGAHYAIRYYDASGRQRWETIGPSRKEAETVLHQRLYEVRSSRFPVIARRVRVTLAVFADEWTAKHLVLVRASSAKRYRELLKHQLLPAFGDQVLTAITPSAVQAFVAEAVRPGRLAPKTVNCALALLKQILAAAAEWGYLSAPPLTKVRKPRLARRSLRLWTPPEIRAFLLAAPEQWRPVWIVALFAGLRPGEIQAMRWAEQNWPDFAANKIHVTVSYEARSKVLGSPKTDRSVRDVDMVPTVRQTLESLPRRAALVFPRADGHIFSRDTMYDAWQRTVQKTGVRRIRPYDLRHTYASLLIAAGKNPLYIARQMGHYSAGFTLETYGHLMESVPKAQVEWIDEIVFPEGLSAALNLHLFVAPRGAAACSPMLPEEARNPLKNQENRSVVQRDAADCLVPPARFELEGQEFIALNGGPQFKFTEAISFLVNCETQEEVDELWEKLSQGGEKSRCGWLKDKFGVSWPIVPTVLGKLLQDKDPEKSQRVMHAVLQMDKLDIRRLQQAYDHR